MDKQPSPGRRVTLVEHSGEEETIAKPKSFVITYLRELCKLGSDKSQQIPAMIIRPGSANPSRITGKYFGQTTSMQPKPFLSCPPSAFPPTASIRE